MSDYIMNRESLKRHCEAMCHKFKDVPTSGTYGEYRLVLDLLEQTEWIPVSERLPEKEGLYLVSVKNDHQRRYSKTCYFSRKIWFARQDIIAWMPLPKPYEPQETQESDHKCHTCKHYTSGEHDGSCGSYICKEYSNWESEG